MVTVLYQKELCGSDLLDLKLIQILKVKEECPGRFSTTDEGLIKKLVENNLRYTTCELSETLNIPKSTIHEHFVKLGYINRFDV